MLWKRNMISRHGDNRCRRKRAGGRTRCRSCNGYPSPAMVLFQGNIIQLFQTGQLVHATLFVALSCILLARLSVSKQTTV